MIGALVNHLWQSTLFVIVVWLLTLALRNNGAHTRYWMWLAASIKFLIPITLVASLAAHIGTRPTPAITPRPVAVLVHQIAQPFAFEASETVGAPAVETAREAPEVTLLSHKGFVPILFGVWISGLVAVLALWLKRWAPVRAAIRSATLLPIEAPIPVMSVASHLEPGIVGIVRPILLLPTGIMENLTPVELQAILAHELCHLRRQDNLTAAIHMLVEAVFWFYPFAWWIGARLIDERERACDEAVVISGNDPQVYAEGILKVCRFYVASPVSSVAGVTGADLKKRIENIMANRIALSLTFTRKLLLAAVFSVVGLSIYEGTGSFAHAAPAASSFGKALVLRDIPSWNRHPDFEDVLKDLGLPFDVKPSSEMSNVNLAGYNFVVIPGAQGGTHYYKAFTANAALFERYVNNGGTLVVEMNGAEHAGITLPGGVSMMTHPSFDNLITFPDHPIFAPLAGKPRITANLASHGYLMDIPGGALILAAEMDSGHLTADMSKPTFVEYTYGKGRILAAAQCFHDQDNSGRGVLMPTLLKYAAAKQWVVAGGAPNASIAPAATSKVTVDPGVFDRYVGYYEFSDIDAIMTVSRDGNRFFAHMNAQPVVEIFPASETQYFAKTVGVHYSFEAGADGHASQLTFEQSGREFTGHRADPVLTKQTLDALERRIREGVPTLGSEAALRRHIAELAAGKPNYDLMSRLLADAVRVQLVGIKERLDSLGPVESVRFTRVDWNGMDAYDVEFKHGSASFGIKLNSNGTISGSRFGESQ